MNRLHNCKNPHQGDAKKVLCVCSAGLLRSPTTAELLSQEYGYNTRACGLHDYALIEIDEVLHEWADEIVVMDEDQRQAVINRFGDDTPIQALNIPDNFAFRDPELVEIIQKAYKPDSALPSANRPTPPPPVKRTN